LWANENETQWIRLSAVVVLIAVAVDNESWLTVRQLISNVLHTAVLMYIIANKVTYYQILQ